MNIPGRYIEFPGAGPCPRHILTCLCNTPPLWSCPSPTFPSKPLFMLLIFCLVHLSRYMPCLCVSPLSGFSSPTLRRPHLSSPPAYRICCLLTLVHLQSARFPRRCPEAGKNSTAPGLSLKPITTNAVCSLGHRRRPNPLSYCCVGGNLCR